MSDSTSVEPPAPSASAAADPGEEFLQRWQRGQAPELEAFLAQVGPLSPAQIAAILRVDQRQRWSAGDRVIAESYLQRFPILAADRESVLDLVYGEFLMRERRGEQPTGEEFRQRFPDLAADLQDQIELHQAMADGDTQRSNPGQPADDAAAAVRVPGYEIHEELGRGGMGVVYKARHVQLKRLVALKVLLGGAHAGPEQRARFRTEAEAVARLQHPNIVQIHEVGEASGCPFLALELVDGGSLRQKLSGVPQPTAQSAHLVETLARAVDYAHQHGVVHRDLKPANVLLSVVSSQWSVVSEDKQRISSPLATGH